MRRYNVEKIISGVLTVVMTTTLAQPVFAEELNTEIPSAGATVAIEEYINNVGSEEDLSKYLPAPEQKTQPVQKVENKNESKESKMFSDIAIARVSGGREDYVNVRKKPNAKSKRVGKIYNNCGARIVETTKSGWYKIVSGNCRGYIKAEYFVTGKKAQSNALDNGYVFANVKDSGVHVRKSANTKGSIVTNVYHNENYVIKKFSDDGKWVKVKIGDGVSGWVSSDYVKVSVDMETAITNAEEKAKIKAQKEQEERERQAQLAAEAEQNKQSDNNDEPAQNSNINANNNSNNSNNTYTPPKTNTPKPTSKPSYGNASGSGASAVVAYAKQFLGNPYVYGGSSLTNGTDCSGFTMSVYAHFGYSLNRSSYTQVYNGRAVSMSALLPGDLLFYKYNSSTISHVAMYIGGGQIIHASTPSTGIIISGMGSPCAARRIIN
ncbi:MAG: SH3 domain-containing protein [Eubacterium sp.]|jgi:cell wall-associated NlpC family hydrolase|nr:SH3 domain-containing protein [Eubacterium sp.]